MAAFCEHQNLRRDYFGMFKKDGNQGHKFNLCPKSSVPSLRSWYPMLSWGPCETQETFAQHPWWRVGEENMEKKSVLIMTKVEIGLILSE